VDAEEGIQLARIFQLPLDLADEFFALLVDGILGAEQFTAFAVSAAFSPFLGKHDAISVLRSLKSWNGST
jgi:hypothetical protein